MTLAETLYAMMQENARAGQPTDLRIGTVTAVSPLEISINAQMAPLKAEVLLLTAAVVEKKLTYTHTHSVSDLSHTHTVDGQSSSTALSGTYDSGQAEGDIVCTENGAALAPGVINRGLQVGDKVILLRVQSGQRFIVLSRVYGGG